MVHVQNDNGTSGWGIVVLAVECMHYASLTHSLTHIVRRDVIIIINVPYTNQITKYNTN